MEQASSVFVPRRRGPGWRVIAILALIAFALGAAAIALLVRTKPAWFGIQPTLTVAQVKTANGQTPVVIVPAAGPPAALPAVDLNALSTREAALSARLSDLESRTALVGGDAAVASGYATRAEGMLVAFAARRAIDRGLGLGYLDEQLRERFGATQPRAVAIVLYAARNPVTLADLSAGLDGVGPSLVAGGDGDWLSSLRRELSTLVIVHRDSVPSPLPVDRLQRAKRLLDAGQVEAAYAEIARMPGADEAQGWLQAARRYVAARRALDAIEAAAIAGPPAPTAVVPPVRVR